MDRINVILCTYNGEKYLSALLDSLLAQTYGNVVVYIRDDGSTDQTNAIISDYKMRENERVSFCVLEDQEGNMGYVKNFLYTIRNSSDAEYYAFCDQDDYWLPEKLEHAVTALKTRQQDRCLLYSSGYEVRDENLNFVDKGHRPTPIEQFDVGKSLSLYDGGWLLGFTLVMNRTLKEKAFHNEATEMYSHDIWVQAVTAGFGGELICSEQVDVYFRRHSSTTSIAESNVNKSFFDAWKYRWEESFGNGKMFARLNSSMRSYATVYQGEVENEKDMRFLRVFGSEEKNKLQKLIYPYRLKKSFLVELAWRFAILIGKI